MVNHCPKCGTSMVWERKTKRPKYKCSAGHEFNTPSEAIDWDELEPCYRRLGELWNPYRVNIQVEDFGALNVTVDTEGMQDVVCRFVGVAYDQAF